MAAGIIKFNRSTDAMRKAVSAITKIREGLEELRQQRAMMIQYCDGPTGTAANWDLFAQAGEFLAGDYTDANSAAKASFDELDTLFAKLSVDASVSNVNTAILQSCAKHGV